VNESPIFANSLLERVREGMTVLDASGRPLGSVARVQLGDPQAVTAAGQDEPAGEAGVVVAPASTPGGSIAFGAATPVAGAGPRRLDIPEQLRRELLRAGFIELDGPDLDASERFVPGDRIEDVTNDAVRLRPSPAVTSPPVTAERAGSASSFASRSYASAAAPSRPRQSVPAAALYGVAGVGASGALAAVVWFFVRRRAQQRPVNRLRRGGQAIENALRERPGASAGALGGVLLLALLLPRLVRGRPEAASDRRTARTRGRES
jgi:hypothetical protein